MNLFYDHTNNSIQIGHTLDEYLKAVGENNGIQFWVSIDDDIDLRIKYRHEHAHFSSYNSTGLIELQSAYHDYKLFLFINYITYKIQSSKSELLLPLIVDRNANNLDEVDKVFLNSLKQINQQEAFFFGWGTDLTVGELFNFNIQDKLCEVFKLPYWYPSISRFRKLTKQLLYTSQLHNTANLLMPKVQFPDGLQVNITSRAVIESYAITIEIFAEYIKTIVTNFTKFRETPKRFPNKNNLIPIELILQSITKEKIAIEDYVYCKIPINLHKVYHCVSLITTAAMQIPAIEDYMAESIYMGSIKQLCPAHRLVHILQSIDSGKIPNPIEIADYYNRDLILDWLNKCHQSIGDPWSIKLYQHIHDVVSNNYEAFSFEEQKYSKHKTSWLGRCCFYRDPCDFLSEAGILHNHAGFQIRYVKTADGKVVAGWHKSIQEILFSYLVDSCLHIFEAICIGDRWEDCWNNLGFIDLDDETKKQYVTLPLSFFLNKQFQDMEKALAFIPELKIRKEFETK
jgi:hypothetical protein